MIFRFFLNVTDVRYVYSSLNNYFACNSFAVDAGEPSVPPYTRHGKKYAMLYCPFFHLQYTIHNSDLRTFNVGLHLCSIQYNRPVLKMCTGG